MADRRAVSRRGMRRLGMAVAAGVVALAVVMPATAEAKMSGTFSLNKGARYSVSTTVTGDSRIKRATSMSFKTGGSWSRWQKYRASTVLTLTAGDGKKTVHARYRDSRGKVITRADSIVLDTHAPTGQLVLDGDPVTTDRLTLMASPLFAGAAKMRHRVDEQAWSAWHAFSSKKMLFGFATEGTHTIEFQFRDSAGNRTDVLRRFGIQDAVLRVGTDPGFAPFEFKENGVIVGFDADIVAELARRLGLDYSFTEYSFGDLVGVIEQGNEVDMMASAMTITSEREKHVSFSDVYYSDAEQGSLGIAFNKANSALRNAVNTALAAMRADGTYDAIRAKWF